MILLLLLFKPMKKNETVAVLFLIHFCLPAQDKNAKTDTIATDSLSLLETVFSSSGDRSESGSDQQDISSLLQASPDIFSRYASFQFSAARYRLRGYQAENHLVMINGVSVNDPSTGAASWSSWGGLTDVARQIESRSGITAGRDGMSGAGGYTNIDAFSSSFKKNTRLSYTAGNRNFRHRFLMTHATGMMSNGWALCFSVSGRTGNEVQIPGTYIHGQSYFLGIDRRLSRKNMLSFTGFVAPLEQGRRQAATQEAYSLSGTNYYNSAWGYQNGEVRNANISKTFRPVLLLAHKYNNGDKGKLVSTFYFSFGKSKSSGLNWSDAPNPKPDYYRYMPGYYYLQRDSATGDLLSEAWTHEDNRQLSWDKMIHVNQNNLYSDPHIAGQTVNTEETRARYIVEDQVESMTHGVLNVLYNRRIKKVFLSTGLNITSFSERKYKEVNDLLGASFWLDVDQFAENLGVEESLMQNDIDQPNRKVRLGERFGYDYSYHVRRLESWLQAEYSGRKFEAYGAASFRYATMSREGFTANGKFPTTSKGKGKTMSFITGTVKGGVTYKFSGRHFLNMNVIALTRAPEIDNVYVSPRVRQDVVNNAHSEKLYGGDIAYHIKYPGFRFRFSAYYTKIEDQTWLRTFWHDAFNNNVNLIMTALDQRHQGIEIGIEKDVVKRHTLQFIGGYGQYLYAGRPQLQAWQDNNAAPLFKDRIVYLNNYRVGESPQTIAACGYKYSGRKNWFINVSGNYAGGICVEPNPDRRTAEATDKYTTGEEDLASVITDQQQLKGYYFVNAMAGKSFRIKRKYFLSLNLSLNNLLNNRQTIVSGFEQMRWDAADINTFPPKYTYLTGISFLFTISLNFK